MNTPGPYTVMLAKGQGMVSETILLLKAWQPGMSPAELGQLLREQGLIAKASARRASDLVKEVFAPRFLCDDARPAKYLRALVENDLGSEKLRQLFLLHTARANAILRDFIVEVYWKHYSAGAAFLQTPDALTFILGAHATGRIPRPWSESMKIRMAQYLLACLTDFGLTRDRPKAGKEIRPFAILNSTTLYLAHEAHFAGLSDHAVLDHADWKLFGLDRRGVLEELRKVADEGHFIVQFSGDLLRVSWKYKTMEECLDGIAQR